MEEISSQQFKEAKVDGIDYLALQTGTSTREELSAKLKDDRVAYRKEAKAGLKSKVPPKPSNDSKGKGKGKGKQETSSSFS